MVDEVGGGKLEGFVFRASEKRHAGEGIIFGGAEVELENAEGDGEVAGADEVGEFREGVTGEEGAEANGVDTARGEGGEGEGGACGEQGRVWRRRGRDVGCRGGRYGGLGGKGKMPPAGEGVAAEKTGVEGARDAEGWKGGLGETWGVATGVTKGGGGGSEEGREATGRTGGGRARRGRGRVPGCVMAGAEGKGSGEGGGDRGWEEGIRGGMWDTEGSEEVVEGKEEGGRRGGWAEGREEGGEWRESSKDSGEWHIGRREREEGSEAG